MQTENKSDTDQSKQIPPSKFICQHHLQSSEMSFCDEATSPIDQNMPKCYRRMRASSVPRIYVTDTSWRDYDFSSCCTADFRRTPAIFIEQDVISKQRQEIQLLMEELSNRDQELNDLVISHQKQVKVWECDNKKQAALQARLNLCEGELKSKEEQLKKTFESLAKMKEQSEVDALELNRTHNEMIKLTERMMENSEYIQEVENQNNKLNKSLRDALNARQADNNREKEFLSCLKDKDLQLKEKESEIAKMADHIKYLDCQCQELGERNNNMTEESVNWKIRFAEMKAEADRLSEDCRKKEVNLQKMTQQLHEALQQAIALQKALFISCEREKCKEEVMYSLRKQHKRTMQELHNTRELYDRLSRDTMYHLNIKDSSDDDKGKEVGVLEEEDKRTIDGRHDEEVDKWHQEIGRKMNTNERSGSSQVDFIDNSAHGESIYRNSSRNAEAIDSASASKSHFDISKISGQHYAGSFVIIHNSLDGPDCSQDTHHLEIVHQQQRVDTGQFDSQTSKNVSGNVAISRNNDFFRLETGKETHDPCSQKQTVEFASVEKLTGYVNEQQPQFAVPNFEVYSPTCAERNCSSAENRSFIQSTCLQSSHVAENLSENSSQDRAAQKQISSSRESETPFDERHLSDKKCFNESEKYQQFNSVSSHEQQNDNYQDVNLGENHINRPILTAEENVVPLWHEPCDKCRGKGRQCCNCPVTQMSSGPKSNIETVDLDFSKTGVNALRNNSVTRTPKVSFVEVNSSLEYGSYLEDSKKSCFQNLEKKDKQTDISRIDDAVKNINSSAFRYVNKKVNMSTPTYETFHNQSNISYYPKPFSENLPDDVAVYLARQHPIRREEYYNNNNKSDCHQINFEPKVKLPKKLNIENEVCYENSKIQKFMFFNKQDFYENACQVCVPKKENSRICQDTERTREEQRKYKIFQNKRKETFHDSKKVFGERDNNNNRMEVMYDNLGKFCDVSDNTEQSKECCRGNVNNKSDVTGEINTRDSVKGNNNNNTTLSVKDTHDARCNVNKEDVARLDVICKEYSSPNVNDEDMLNVKYNNIIQLNIENRDNTTLNVKDIGKTRQDVKCMDTARVDVSGRICNKSCAFNKNITRSNVKNKSNSKQNVNEKDNDAKLEMSEEDDTRLNVNGKMICSLDVKNKNIKSSGNPRMDVNDRNNVTLDVKDVNNATVDVKNVNMARLDVKNIKLGIATIDTTSNGKVKDDARLDAKDTNKAILYVRSIENASLDVATKDNVRINVMGKSNARFDMRNREYTRLPVKTRLCTLTQKSSFLKKTVIFSSVDRLALKRRQLVKKQTSEKSETGIAGPVVEESYFCPED